VYAKARARFDACADARPTAGAVRLAAGRLHHLTGNYDQALGHMNAILTNANVGVAAQYEKATLLADTANVKKQRPFIKS